MTRGYVQSGQRDQATATLLDADQTSPEEVRCRPMTKQIVSDILHSYPRSSSAPAQLTRIAVTLGVTA
ncbi:MAG: hypothetical protein M3R63_11995 [Actinomycetota bacterium]|nr:hypothetical protein [Actinomycetota bacterium]